MKEDKMVKTQPLHGASTALPPEQVAESMARLGEGWRGTDDGYLTREYPFRDFAAAHAFADAVARMAIKLDHFPEIAFGWGRVEIRTRTPRAAGLTDIDFLIAFRADQAYAKLVG